MLIHDFLLVGEGRFREEELVALLRGGRYPARNIPERLSDTRAAIAANAVGVRLLGELVERYGLEVVRAYMQHVRDNAEEAMRAVLRELPDGEHRFEDFLDDGSRIAVTVRIAGDRAVVDSRPLLWDGRALYLGSPVAEAVRTGSGGRTLLPGLSPGDTVALHWDWVCDRLTARQQATLERLTRHQLTIPNHRTGHPGRIVG